MNKAISQYRMVQHIQVLIYWALKGLVLLGFALEVYLQNWQSAFAVFGIFMLTMALPIVKVAYRLYMPIEFDLIILFFIFSSLFLGEVGDFYARFWWWDLFLHGWSSMLLGILGFLVVFLLHQREKINLFKPFFIALFAFAFATMIGCFWEIFEYGMDTLLGLNMQKTGLDDTMEDLMVNAVGAFTMSYIGYLWLKKRIQFFVFDVTLQKFVRKNARIFFPLHHK